MKIRADTNNPEEVPKVGDVFIVRKVKKDAAFWTVELEDWKKEDFVTKDLGELKVDISKLKKDLEIE